MALKQITAYQLTKESLDSNYGPAEMMDKRDVEINVFYLIGEIEQAPGHGIFLSRRGTIYSMIHIDNFEMISEDDF